jgi:hypothetical protein
MAIALVCNDCDLDLYPVIGYENKFWWCKRCGSIYNRYLERESDGKWLQAIDD